MEGNFMKCTDAWVIMKILRARMGKELKAALAAHGGEYSWYSEEDEKYADNVPIVMCNNRYAGPVDVKVRSVYIDSHGYVMIEAATNDCNDEITIEFEDIVAHHIQFIIESIPATDTVTDVSVPFSAECRDGKLYIDGECCE